MNDSPVKVHSVAHEAGKPMTETRVPEELVEAANGLDHVSSALQEVHALSGRGDPAFDASMFGQIAAVERGASLLRRAALTASGLQSDNDRLRARVDYEVGNWKIRCRHLLECLDRFKMAGAPSSALDREDVIFIAETRAALDTGGDNMRGE